MLRNKFKTPKIAMPYNERIKKYNEEKQSALLMCTTQEEIERVVFFLRKKWAV